jgi:subtilase family serine protease
LTVVTDRDLKATMSLYPLIVLAQSSQFSRERTMRFTHRNYRRQLQIEQLEDRLALSASIGSLERSLANNLSAMKKPVGWAVPHGETPARIRAAYDFDNIDFGGVAGDGAGQTIAIVDARSSPTIANDLAVFDQTFGLPDPPTFTVVNQNGGAKLPKKSRGWAQEIALDVEWAHAIAPAANILLVEAKSASTLGDAIDFARNVPGVTVVSVSAGGKEFKTEQLADELFTTPPGHEGITFVFAAGDDGGVAEYPSSSPNVLSVGGTSLDLSWNGSIVDETVWSDGGGGPSKYEGLPSYQDGLGLTTRGTPDVAYNADPETGFAVFDTYGSGGWAQFGGTSAGTPQWAALVAIANQGRARAGKAPLANAQAALYAMPSSDFHDIVSGNNGSQAHAGYDLATGLGSPIANSLVSDLVAFNGSTDFTVASPPAPINKSHKHSSAGLPTLTPIVLQLNGAERPLKVTPAVVPQLTMLAESIWDQPSETVAPSPKVHLYDDDVFSVDDKRTRPIELANQHDRNLKSSGDAFAEIDAFFTSLAG